MLEIYLTLASHHLDDGNYNEINPGIMLEYNEWVFGGYKNSFSDLSVIAAKKFDWQHEKWNYGFIAGGVTGYEYEKLTIRSITPFAAPYVSYDFGEIKPTVLILGSAVTLSVGFTF